MYAGQRAQDPVTDLDHSGASVTARHWAGADARNRKCAIGASRSRHPGSVAD
jgi:hypothetical protein